MKVGIRSSLCYYARTKMGLWLKGEVDLTEGSLALYWQRRVEFDAEGNARCIDADGNVFQIIPAGSGKVLDEDSWHVYVMKNIDILPRVSSKYDVMEYYRMLLLHGLNCTIEGIGDSIDEVERLFDDVSKCEYLIDTDYTITLCGGELLGCPARYDSEVGNIVVDIGGEEHAIELDEWSDYLMWLVPTTVHS